MFPRFIILTLALVVAAIGQTPAHAVPGDLNCDGAVDGSDVGAFALAVIAPSGYQAAYPGCHLSNGDFDCDGNAGTNDISGFVDCLLAGNCPLCTLMGACCDRFTGGCTVTMQAACTYSWTPNVSCSPNPCPQPGACCQPTGTCTVVQQAACTGTWQGPGTTCSPNPCPQPGACCQLTGACTVLQQAA